MVAQAAECKAVAVRKLAAEHKPVPAEYMSVSAYRMGSVDSTDLREPAHDKSL